MTAVLTSSYSTGSSMWATLRVELPADIDVRTSFRQISDMVRVAARSKVDSWHKQHYSVELSIVICCPKEPSDSDANLVSCAVCDALGIIPRADMLWNGKSLRDSRE